MYEENLTKERLIKKTFEVFYKSEDNQIRDCNRVMLLCEESMMQNHIHGKGIKANATIIKSIYDDLKWIFERMQPDKLLTPRIYDITFVGRDGMGLPMKHVPAKV